MSKPGHRRALDAASGRGESLPDGSGHSGRLLAMGADEQHATTASKFVQRLNDSVTANLQFERKTVIQCCKDLPKLRRHGKRVTTVVLDCVRTRLCPTTSDPAALAQQAYGAGPLSTTPQRPAYCEDYTAGIRSTIKAGVRRIATEEEAAAAAAAAKEAGLDGLLVRRADVYRHNRQLYDDGHPLMVTVVERLMALADTKIAEPIEVIPDKSYMPPNGDKRTYVSLATYCWPANPEDLENPKGPWTCKDGVPFTGKDIIAPDFAKMMNMQQKVLAVAGAYFFSGDEKYAENAAATLRAFYLDPETGMLPSLLYAQLRGDSKVGATVGTIDNHAVHAVFDAVALLSGSAAWTEADHAALHTWFTQYMHHLQSEHCRNESMQENNHGTYFDVQYLSILLFLDRREDALAFIENVVTPRLRAQITGSVMATEMARPKSYSYHSFTLEGYVQLAVLSEKLGVNLWDLGADTGNSILDAWDWMIPHWCDRSTSIWPVRQVKDAKLDLNRPQEYTGLVYTHATAAADAGDAYTLRARQYALLYHSLRGGPDPKHEMDEARALLRQVGLVKFDDCYIAFCPDRPVLPIDAPTYPAPNCIPALDAPLTALDATQGPLRGVVAAGDILPALIKGDDPATSFNQTIWVSESAAARTAGAAEVPLMAGGRVAGHLSHSQAVLLLLAAVVVVAMSARATLHAVRRKMRVR
eukprot:jgi/Ulvmu1/3256/UM151_0004.1